MSWGSDACATTGSYFAASAYSKFRPIDSAKTEDPYRQNRRIEISVVSKERQPAQGHR